MHELSGVLVDELSGVLADIYIYIVGSCWQIYMHQLFGNGGDPLNHLQCNETKLYIVRLQC